MVISRIVRLLGGSIQLPTALWFCGSIDFHSAYYGPTIRTAGRVWEKARRDEYRIPRNRKCFVCLRLQFSLPRPGRLLAFAGRETRRRMKQEVPISSSSNGTNGSFHTSAGKCEPLTSSPLPVSHTCTRCSMVMQQCVVAEVIIYMHRRPNDSASTKIRRRTSYS